MKLYHMAGPVLTNMAQILDPMLSVSQQLTLTESLDSDACTGPLQLVSSPDPTRAERVW